MTLNEIITGRPGRKNIICPKIDGTRDPDAMTRLTHDIRFNADCYDNNAFHDAAIQAIIESAGLNAAQAEVIVSGAMERRHDWTDAHDYGNLLQEIEWYCILHDSIARHNGE